MPRIPHVRPTRNRRLDPRPGLAAVVVGALILLGTPTMASAEEVAPDPAAAAAPAPDAAAPADDAAADPAVSTDPAAAPDPAAESDAAPDAAPAAPDQTAGTETETAPPSDAAPGTEAPAPATEATAPEAAAPAAEAVPAPENAPAPQAFALSAPAVETAKVVDEPPHKGGTGTEADPYTWNGSNVGICHATASETNPYVFNEPSARSIINNTNGHDTHEGDVIPEFWYYDGDGAVQHYLGKNLDLGVVIGKKDCDTPPPPGTPTLHVTHSVCVSPESELTITEELAGLTVGKIYTVSLRNAADQLVGTVTFGAVGETHEFTFDVSATGDYTVTLTSEDFPELKVVASVTILPCPGEPSWQLTKSSWPEDGDTVVPGQIITYTLTATNTSDVEVSGAKAFDDLSDVLDNATFGEAGPGLAGPSGDQLVWTVPTLAPMGEEGDTATTWYTVQVGDDVFGELLHNVVSPSSGGSCPSDDAAPSIAVSEGDDCVVDHPVVEIDLGIVKDTDGVPVDSGEGDVIGYTLTITNHGDDPAYNPTVTDTLPEGVTFIDGSDVPGAGWSAAEVGDGMVSWHYSGWFEPGQVSVITFEVSVGELAQPASGGPIDPIVNTACVAGEPYPQGELERTALVDEGDDPVAWDSDPSNDCDDAETPVKSVGLTGGAMCVNDTPLFSYAVTPFNIDPESNPIALIWWTPEAFANRDPSIDAGDTAALLADGASQVDVIAYPAGWASGDTISGSQLWPGAAVDAAGNPIAWPGWRQLPTGQWVLDPSAPFYDLRESAIVEIRINPTTDQITAYPPATPDCNAAPPSSTPQGSASTPLASTGFDGSPLMPALALVILGALAVGYGVRRHRRA
ncbi:DUF7927 domain-containing protein [Agromyces soli]